jgi:uncharacterized membrane protein
MMMKRTVAFTALHLAIAVSVGYAITGSFVLAGATALVEPLANGIAFHYFNRWWERRYGGNVRRAAAAGARRNPGSGRAPALAHRHPQYG